MAMVARQAPDLGAVVAAVGGGSQAVGALVATRALRPHVAVFGVQAADTFAKGLATGATYALTFDALREGLAGFSLVERRRADARRILAREI